MECHISTHCNTEPGQCQWVNHGSISVGWQRKGCVQSPPAYKDRSTVCRIFLSIRQTSEKDLGSAEFVCWVTENNQPFRIVEDHGFQSLMKTGRPGYYIPSADTLSRDVKNVFVWVHGRIAKTLKVGYTNFIYD